MNPAAHYRYQAKHARQLADAAWQLDLQDTLRSLAQDYDEIAERCDQDQPRRASGRVISPTQGNGDVAPPGHVSPSVGPKENPGRGKMPGLRSGSRG
jgi:hypothetical protein